MLKNVVILCFCVFSSYYGVAAEKGANFQAKLKPHTVRLKKDLLCAYDKSVRPVISHHTTTYVYVTMLLRSLNFDEYIGSLNIHCWMVWTWLDEKLRWNASDYGGVDVLIVDSDEIWVPEISQLGLTSVWNPRHNIHKGRCGVEPDGLVVCVPPTVYSSICALDVTYWPYDVINCTLAVGAWMQTGEEITVNDNGGIVDLQHYEPNADWELLSVTSTMHLELLQEDTTFPWIQYSFVLRRHAGKFEATVGVPALVIISLVLISFWLPPLEDSRIKISCVNLICHSLYLMYLCWTLINSGDKNPLIVQLYRDSMLLAGLSLVVSIFLRRLTSKSTAPPRWVSGIISWILSCRTGQILLLARLSPEDAAFAQEADTEAALLEESHPADEVRGWPLFVKLLNRVCFIVAALLYCFMFARCFI